MSGLPALTRLVAAWLILGAAKAPAHGDYHDVVRNLTPRIQAEPENTKLRYQLVAAHVEHDEWKLALAECDRIEKLAPGKHQLGYFRGRSLATAERWQDALAPLDEFLSSASAHEEARVWRARVHLQLKDPAKAVADYRAALEKSRNPDHHAEFARALVEQDQTKEAVTALQHGLKVCPDDPALLECMVECATAAKDQAATLTAIERLIKTWPRPEPWMLRRAQVLADFERKDESIAAWKALESHLQKLPNLERAQPFLVEIEAHTHAALGVTPPAPVVAPPAPAPGE